MDKGTGTQGQTGWQPGPDQVGVFLATDVADHVGCVLSNRCGGFSGYYRFVAENVIRMEAVLCNTFLSYLIEYNMLGKVIQCYIFTLQIFTEIGESLCRHCG